MHAYRHGSMATEGAFGKGIPDGIGKSFRAAVPAY
jgi:hypothetical protein